MNDYLPRLVAVTISREPRIIVGLPGAGFDAGFIEAAFAPLATDLNAELWAVSPEPGRVVDSYLEACREAAQTGPFIAVGISIGAVALAQWAVAEATHPTPAFTKNCRGLIMSMAPWTAVPSAETPAAVTARGTAQMLAEQGFGPVRDLMCESSPEWLVRLQQPCWDRLGDNLRVILREVADTPAPSPAELEQITAPCGVLGVADDPNHPSKISREWAQHIPTAVYSQISLNDIAQDVRVLSTAINVLKTHL